MASGSSLPFAKAVRNAAARENFTAGLIDRDEALKAMDWPNWEEVARRMAEKEAQAAAAQPVQ